MGPITPRLISFSLRKRSIINKRVSKMDLKADRQNIIISKFSEYPSSQSIATELVDGNKVITFCLFGTSIFDSH